MFDLNKEIEPEKSVGGIFLGSSINLLQQDLLEKYQEDLIKIIPENPISLRYEYSPGIIITINIMSGKIIKISAFNNYIGKYNGIYIGMTIAAVKAINENFYYDESEELAFIRGIEGISFDINQSNGEVIENIITAITVYDNNLLDINLL